MPTTKNRKRRNTKATNSTPAPIITEHRIKTVTAYHLAGIVAAMHQFGWKPQVVYAHRGETKSSQVVFPPFFGHDATSHDDAKRQCMCLLAGKLAFAEMIKRLEFFSPHSALYNGWLGILDEPYQILLYDARHNPEVFRWRAAPMAYILEKMAKKAFSDNWDLIEVITGALMDHGTLTGDECVDLLS